MPKISSITFAAVFVATLLPTQSQAAPVDDFCTNMGSIARTIMKARQHDIAMSKMMAFINTNKSFQNRIIQTASKKMLIEAYGRPDFSVEENQLEAIQSFGNEVEHSCYKEMTQ
jgi:hypothetical protein